MVTVCFHLFWTIATKWALSGWMSQHHQGWRLLGQSG